MHELLSSIAQQRLLSNVASLRLVIPSPCLVVPMDSIATLDVGISKYGFAASEHPSPETEHNCRHCWWLWRTLSPPPPPSFYFYTHSSAPTLSLPVTKMPQRPGEWCMPNPHRLHIHRRRNHCIVSHNAVHAWNYLGLYPALEMDRHVTNPGNSQRQHPSSALRKGPADEIVC